MKELMDILECRIRAIPDMLDLEPRDCTRLSAHGIGLFLIGQW